MESLTLNVRVDSKDKKDFEKFCNNVGMNVSTAINLFIKAVLREQKIPFEVKDTTFDNYIYEKLIEAEKEMKQNNKTYTIEELEEGFNKVLNR